MFKFLFLIIFLYCVSTQAHENGNLSASRPLASGYGALRYTPPTPGSYRLPPLGPAADGSVLLISGEPTQLYDLFVGKIVLLSFIYTSCSDINGCPLATVVLQRINQRVLDDPELNGQLRAISLSFDPAHDTPPVLARYSETLTAAIPDWRFVTTASDAELLPILDAYGQNIVKEYGDDGKIAVKYSHNLRVVLIDRQQQIRNIYSVDFLHPDIIVNDIKTLLLDERESRLLRPTEDRTDGHYTAYSGPGDDKRGYKSADYVTRSVHLPNRVGKAADLVALAENPPRGLPAVPVPPYNPITNAKVALGRKLFFDRRLSLNDTLSCAMCHVPEQGFTSNELATAVGFEGRTVRRNAPTLYNVAYMKRLFHDGREFSLENQVWQPMLAANEMANPSIGAVIEKIGHIPDYKGLFEQAFDGRGPAVDTIGMALASYERTLNAADSPFDRWYFGKQNDAMPVAAQRGFKLFTGKAGCSACHTINQDYALFTDNTLHNTGIGWRHSMHKEPATHKVQLAPGVFVDVDSTVIAAASEKPPSDLGLYEVTQNPADRWRYKTPSLRNVALTAPYMHNGFFSTLEDVVEFYNQGAYPHKLLDPLLRPLDLSAQEQADLVAFLRALTGASVEALVMDAFAAPVGDLSEEDPHWTHANRINY